MAMNVHEVDMVNIDVDDARNDILAHLQTPSDIFYN